MIARMPSGPDPHEVAASADGRFAYISNYGGGAYNTLTVVDLVEQKTLTPVDLGPMRGPHGLMFVGGKVWFTAEAAKAIGSYDPQTKKIDWLMGTGQNGTHMIYVFDGLQRVITSNIASATMTFIEKSAARGPGSGGPPPGGPGPGGPPPRDNAAVAGLREAPARIGMRPSSRSAEARKVLTSLPTARKSGRPMLRTEPSRSWT